MVDGGAGRPGGPRRCGKGEGKGRPAPRGAQVGEGRPGFGAFVPGEGEGRLTLSEPLRDPKARPPHPPAPRMATQEENHVGVPRGGPPLPRPAPCRVRTPHTHLPGAHLFQVLWDSKAPAECGAGGGGGGLKAALTSPDPRPGEGQAETPVGPCRAGGQACIIGGAHRWTLPRAPAACLSPACPGLGCTHAGEIDRRGRPPGSHLPPQPQPTLPGAARLEFWSVQALPRGPGVCPAVCRSHGLFGLGLAPFQLGPKGVFPGLG